MKYCFEAQEDLQIILKCLNLSTLLREGKRAAAAFFDVLGGWKRRSFGRQRRVGGRNSASTDISVKTAFPDNKTHYLAEVVDCADNMSAWDASKKGSFGSYRSLFSTILVAKSGHADHGDDLEVEKNEPRECSSSLDLVVNSVATFSNFICKYMAPLRSAARLQPKLPSPGLPTHLPYPPLP